jgi:hypothetical protein
MDCEPDGAKVDRLAERSEHNTWNEGLRMKAPELSPIFGPNH